MKMWIKWLFLGGLIGTYVACSPKNFSQDPSYNACQNSGQSCVSENGRDYFSLSEKVGGGKVDVLVVTDNSASMSGEQAQLASRFSGFIQNLESKSMDYRIGVITTDISSAANKPRSVNKNGALQDGKLIPLSNGDAYITSGTGSLSQKDSAFKGLVQRPETLACEQFILSELAKCRAKGVSKDTCIGTSAYMSAYDVHCPSGDERGVFAARLVMEKNPSKFIRKEADLAIIILSDEDVRSGLYRQPYTDKGETHARNTSYSLTDKDRAESFLSFMQSKYPNKTYNVHTITVPYYTDPACRGVQAAQTGGVVGSSIGYQYETLAAAVRGGKKSSGIRGSICSSNYTSLLQNIFNQVQGQVLDKIALACANPPDVTVALSSASGGSSPSISWNVVDDEIRFSSKLPVGTLVKVNYSCRSL